MTYISSAASPTHDLRRTFSSTVTKLGFGREAMNRLTNHKEGGIGDVYDRAEYGTVNRKIWEAVGDHLLALAEGRDSGCVVDTEKLFPCALIPFRLG